MSLARAGRRPLAFSNLGTCKMKRIAALSFSLLLLPACLQDTSGNGWKVEADPTIVNFSRQDAESVDQELVAPPFLPVHDQVASGPPRIVNIRLEIAEREVEIAPGVFVWQMAFNNSVPGPVPVVFQWDWVNLTLVNGTTDTVRFRKTGAGNQLPHNIDFHASTGAHGGGALDYGRSRPRSRAALAGGKGRVLRVPLRAGRADGSRTMWLPAGTALSSCFHVRGCATATGIPSAMTGRSTSVSRTSTFP